MRGGVRFAMHGWIPGQGISGAPTGGCRSPDIVTLLIAVRSTTSAPHDISTLFEITLDVGFRARQFISMKLELAARQLESLGSPIRLKLYRALVRAGEEGLAVGALQSKLDIAASTLSHHIRHLKEAGLIAQERQATTLICRANYPAMNALVSYLVDECCMDSCSSKGRAA
jgi:DNA-binding transcriptional ArsR family regulator